MGDKILKIIVIFFTSVFFAYFCLTGNPSLPITIFIFLLALFLFIKRPYYFILFYLLASLDFLGYINPLTFFYLPGYFKFKDIVFVFGILMIFKMVLIDKYKIHFSKDSPIKIFVFILLLLVTINWIRTFYMYSIEFKSIFQYSRRYLYYSSFLFPLYFIRNTNDLKSFFKILFSICVIYSFLIIIQFFIGYDFNVLGNTVIAKQFLGGLEINRIYIKGLLLLCGVFTASIGYYLSCDKKNKYFFLGIFLIGCGIFLHFSRMFWFFILLTLLLWLIDIHKQYKKIFIIIFSSICVVIFLGLIYSNIELPRNNYIKNIINFSATSFSDVLHYKGTFKFRMEESWFRFTLIEKHPLFGAGFIHPTHLPSIITLSRQERPDIAPVDSGWIALLTDFGIVGALWLILFLISLIRYERNFQKLSFDNSFKHNELKKVSKGVLYFLLLGVIISITHG